MLLLVGWLLNAAASLLPCMGAALHIQPAMHGEDCVKPRSVCMHGAGARLIDMVAAPHALIESHGRLRLNANYYITKQVQLTTHSSAYHNLARGFRDPWRCSWKCLIVRNVGMQEDGPFIDRVSLKAARLCSMPCTTRTWRGGPDLWSCYSHAPQLPLEHHIRVLLL